MGESRLGLNGDLDRRNRSERGSAARSPVPHPFNRKYLGSKRLLRGWIRDIILESAGVPSTFLDGFCGTGCVGLEMSLSGAGKVIAVDNLHSNCLILRGFLAGNRELRERARMGELLDRLNGCEPRDGYITESYAGMYFTRDNCRRMDAIREEIATLLMRGDVSRQTHEYLLACFLLAADRVANTVGQYDAFLKNIDAEPMKGGRHLVDQRVQSPFRLQSLAEPRSGEMEVLCADLLAVVSSLPVDIVYFDPPYNHRQYCANYHVLENLALWKKPPVLGKTRKFEYSAEMKSPFSRRPLAAKALRSLMEQTRTHHVFLSYSSEGILSRENLIEILSGFGNVRIHEFSYPVFGNGAGVSRKRHLTELLFHVQAHPRSGTGS